MLSLIHHYRDDYDRIGRSDKFRIIEEIMGRIEERGGRFMEYKQHKKHWEEVPRAAAYNKVSHAFRSLRRANLPPEARKRNHSERNTATIDSESSAVADGYIAPMHGLPPLMHPANTQCESSAFSPNSMVGESSFNVNVEMPGWGAVSVSSDPHQTYWTQQRDPDGPDPLITPMPDVAVSDDAQNVCAV
jgi:hypothetical protein